MSKRILVFSGAGVSAESGVKTFRDYDGLWENHRIEDVATPEAWNRNQKLVLDFYNQRRRQLNEVFPNEAHIAIAELEKNYQVDVVTQNVDDLHERAGSTKVVHLHGELKKARSTRDKSLIYNWEEDLNAGDKCELGSQLRPHIVWFGEALNQDFLLSAKNAAEQADICIIVGTSLLVFPAAEIPFYIQQNCKLFVIDPNANELNLPIKGKNVYLIPKKASEGMKEVVEWLRENE